MQAEKSGDGNRRISVEITDIQSTSAGLPGDIFKTGLKIYTLISAILVYRKTALKQISDFRRREVLT